MTVFDSAPTRTEKRDRSVALTWDLGPTTSFHGTPATAAAQLLVGHDKHGKQFRAFVQRIDVDDSGPFRAEMHSPFSGTRVRLPGRQVARFSAKALEDAVAASLTALRILASEDASVLAVADPNSPA